MGHNQFKLRSLVLFFVVSSVPALVVGAAWYTAASYEFAIVFALVPALILSIVFAELLNRPIRRIHEAAIHLAGGKLAERVNLSAGGEFSDIGEALDKAAARLEQILSQTSSEMAIIEAERNKLRSVLNSMTDGVFALDQDGRIILYNKAAGELTGRGIEAVAGQLAEKVLPFRKDGELVMTRWLDTHLGTDQKRGEWRGLELYRADGTSLFVDVQATTLNEDPNGIRALVTFHDLTASHQLEEMKVDFVALAAHELRTPITEIRGYLDIMLHEPIGLRPAGRELVERCTGSVTQLSGLINNILGVARIEHGEINYHPTLINWSEYLHEIENELKERANRDNRRFKLKIIGKLPPVMVDTMGLQEVINNLFNNALAHTEPKHGLIEITAKVIESEIETSVRDNGSGIPPEAIKHLFTKFYRYEGLKSTRGTGLGLYMSKSIIESHGGYIWVESEVGKGSTFTFRLPTRSDLAGKRPVEDNSDNLKRGTHGWIKKHSLH